MPLSKPIASNDEISKTIPSSLLSQEPVVNTWYHDCSNTSGFEYMEIPTESWDYWWTHTEVDLESDGQSFLIQSMTNISPNQHYGPVYVYTLPDVFPLSGLHNFSVHMELNNSDPAYYGIVRVGLFDGSYSPVLIAKTHDWFRDDPHGGCRWNYYIRHRDIHATTLDNEDAYYYDMGYSQHWMEFVNMTWSAWFEPSHGLNGSIPAYGPMSARNGTIIPIEEAETARDIRYLVLMFGGYAPFRVHDIYLEYEIGGDIDTTPPSLTLAPDIVYQVGQTGNIIEWNCSDDYPYRYWVLDYENSYTSPSANRKEGLWNGSPYTMSIDGLEVGNRTFLLILQDKAGFMVWDMVTVMVIEHPLISFIRSNAVIIGIVSFVVLVCIINYWNRRKT